MREGLYGFERALGPGGKGRQKKVGILGSTGEALHTLFTNAVHFLFGSWMCFILSQLPFHLIVMPATLTSVYACEFLKHSQYLELQRMRLK